jgi:preprotein translocase subunit SecF
MSKIRQIYEKDYKKLLFIPFVLLLLAFVQIGVQYSTTGDFVNKGISLKGGSTITFDKIEGIDPGVLENSIQSKFTKAEVSVRTLNSAGRVVAISVDSDAQDTAEIDVLINLVASETGLLKNDLSVEIIGSSLGESFFRQTAIALLFAFLLMGIVVFFYFKSLAPSMAVILAAFSDIVVSLAIFNLTGIKLSTAGIAAFLMLIGYSVDTDILLSTRMLRRKEMSVMRRVYSAMKTGLTMTGTTIGVVSVAFIFVQSDVVSQIMVILLIGLGVDLVMTWIQNVGLLRWYLEKNSGKKGSN